MALQGSLRDMTVADIIQVNCQEKKVGKVVIISNNKEALLFFQDGSLTHAELEGMVGEEVIYKILSWDDGEFKFDPDITHPVVTIKRNWSGLLLEGAKRLDETTSVAGLELDTDSSSNIQKDELINGLLKKFAEKYPSMNSIGIVGIDGYIKFAVHRNMVDEAVFGTAGAATYNFGKRTLSLLRMDNYNKSVFGGEKNTMLVCLINPYTLLVGLYSVPVEKCMIDWNSIHELVTDLSTLV